MSEPLYKLKAEFFKTLGHPARIRVLELLVERDRTVAELLPEVGLEPSNLSQQLAVLSDLSTTCWPATVTLPSTVVLATSMVRAAKRTAPPTVQSRIERVSPAAMISRWMEVSSRLRL